MLSETKCVSERHERAIECGLLTAGQMASRINRELNPNPKVRATELKPFAAEWHHSGFMPRGRKYGGSHMGRTYFFAPNADTAQLYALVEADRAEAVRIATEPDIDRYWFAPGFERHGRRWRVFASFGVTRCKPSEPLGGKRTEITRDDYEAMHGYADRDLESYETFSEFKRRMEAEHGNA